MEAETETMSSVLASVSTRKEKAAKALAALHSHRSLITSCITDWENLEKSFGVTERALQQKFKELAERETAHDAKIEEARGALRKREESIAGREEASLARVKEQKDTAVAASVEERRKLEEDWSKWRAEKGISEAEANLLNDAASKEKVQIDKPLAGRTPFKDDKIKGSQKQDLSTPKPSKSPKDEQQKKNSAGGSSSKSEAKEALRKEITSKEMKKVKEMEVPRSKVSEIMEDKKQGDNQEQPSKNKRKDNVADDDAMAKRRKGHETDAKAGADSRKSDAVISAPTLEDAIKIVRLAEDVPVQMQLKVFMEEQNYMGLKEFFVNNRKDLQKLRPDLQAALQACSDPCRLTLKILELSEGAGKLCVSKKCGQGCILLLECLSEVVADPVLGVDFPVVPADVKEVAKSMARRWKSLLESGPQDSFALSSHLFLQLIASFGVGTDYTVEDLLKYVVSMSRRGVGPGLCRTLGLSERISVVVDRLITEGKHIDAIAYAAAFGLHGKYSLESLFSSFLHDSQKKLFTDQAALAGGNSNELYSKQISALKNTIKVLEDHKLGLQLPMEILHNRISELKKERAAIKKAGTSGKQEMLPEKGPIESESARPNGVNAIHKKEDVGLQSYLDSGRETDGGYFSSYKRGDYVPTDLGRPGRMDYTPTDIGKPLFPAPYSLDRFNGRQDSMYDKYGIGNRSPVLHPKSNQFASWDAIGSYSRNPPPNLPGAGIQSYGGMRRDDPHMTFPRDDPHMAFPSSRGKLPYPEAHLRPTQYPAGSGPPPSSSYLPYYLR